MLFRSSTLGLRLGDGAEISYQHPLGTAHRLEFDLGTVNSGLGLTGIYQWNWGLEELATGFAWYAGAGATIGKYTGLGIAGVGQIGIEYNFAIPLQLSIDYRPTLYLVPNVNFASNDGRLSVRYRF